VSRSLLVVHHISPPGTPEVLEAVLGRANDREIVDFRASSQKGG
jgi:hypothetical protein